MLQSAFFRFSSGWVDNADLSDPMEVESRRVGWSVSVSDGTIDDVVDQSNLERDWSTLIGQEYGDTVFWLVEIMVMLTPARLRHKGT